jgi:hypothetical protein
VSSVRTYLAEASSKKASSSAKKFLKPWKGSPPFSAANVVVVAVALRRPFSTDGDEKACTEHWSRSTDATKAKTWRQRSVEFIFLQYLKGLVLWRISK